VTFLIVFVSMLKIVLLNILVQTMIHFLGLFDEYK